MMSNVHDGGQNAPFSPLFVKSTSFDVDGIK